MFVKKVLKTLCFKRFAFSLLFIFLGLGALYAQNAAAGVQAVNFLATEAAKYIDPVKKLLYAVAAIVGFGGVITIFVKMNNEEQDIKKTIMLVIGSCVILIALAEAIPLFFSVK